MKEELTAIIFALSLTSLGCERVERISQDEDKIITNSCTRLPWSGIANIQLEVKSEESKVVYHAWNPLTSISSPLSKVCVYENNIETCTDIEDFSPSQREKYESEFLRYKRNW